MTNLHTNSNLPVLIVGAGQAGATAAAELRKFGCAKPIILCGAETHAPYERPPLSKYVLADQERERDIFIHPASFYEDHGIDLRLGTTVVALNAKEKTAYFKDGSKTEYRSCLIATGGNARVLPELPQSTPGVHYVRTLQNARDLRSALESKTHILVIGGGFLGLEIASSARTSGHEVTLVEAAARLLPRALPAVLSDWLAERARAIGINLRLGVSINAVAVEADGVKLNLSSGTSITAALVIVAVGLLPEVELARNAGLLINHENGGISVGPDCSSSLAGIYAAGDCASQMNPFFGREVRLESWQNANVQAQCAAAAIAGAVQPKNVVPWFWTDQLGWNVQIYGEYDSNLEYVLRGEIPSALEPGKFMLLGGRAGVLRHAIAINAGGDLRQTHPLFERHVSCNIAALADHTQPLRKLVAVALNARA